MNKHVPHWLNNAELQRIGGRYEGAVARVVEQKIENRFKKEKHVEPVIEFIDGYRLVPNIAMRRLLIERLGADTDAWVGARLVIVCHRSDRIDKQTGVVHESWTKHLQFPDDHSDAADPMGDGDEGHIDADIRPFARRSR